MTKEPWFRATWTSYMPVHRVGWLLVVGVAALVTVLVAAGVLAFQATQEPLWVYVPGGIAFAAIAAMFAIALTRTRWG